MREIKFRAWDGVRMYEWGFLKEGVFTGPSSSAKGNPMTMIQMQSTGLRDRNGREIYEGDVIRWTSTFHGASQDEHTDMIKWDEDSAGFYIHPWCHEIYKADMEVIGNIYENGDLLGTTGG